MKVGFVFTFVVVAEIGAIALNVRPEVPDCADQTNVRALPLLTVEILVKLKVEGDEQKIGVGSVGVYAAITSSTKTDPVLTTGGQMPPGFIEIV